MHWLKQPTSGQPIILVVAQPMGLVRGYQYIGKNNQYPVNQLYWLSSNQQDWSGVTNVLVTTTNIGSTNYIGCRTTNWIGQG